MRTGHMLIRFALSGVMALIIAGIVQAQDADRSERIRRPDSNRSAYRSYTGWSAFAHRFQQKIRQRFFYGNHTRRSRQVVQVRFNNDARKSVRVSPKGKDWPAYRISPGSSRIVRAKPGQVWQISRKGRPLAFYTATGRRNQHYVIEGRRTPKRVVYITFENRTDRSIKIRCDADRGRRRRDIDVVPPGRTFHMEAAAGDLFRFEGGGYSGSYLVTDRRTQRFVLQDESCPVTALNRR